MSAPMTMHELGNLINFIRSNNCPFNAVRGLPVIKYIDPHIDNRDGRCFSITFRRYGDEVNFTTTNEQRDNPKSLYDRCMTYVQTGEVT